MVLPAGIREQRLGAAEKAARRTPVVPANLLASSHANCAGLRAVIDGQGLMRGHTLIAA